MTTLEPTTAQTQAPIQSHARESNRRRWLARVLWALALVFIAAGVIFLSTNPNTDIGERFGFRGNDALIGLVYATVGLLIASRHPRNLVGWLFLLLGLGQAFEFLITEYATYALLAFPGSLPSGAVMAWLQNFLWPIGLVILYFVLPLIFPQGRLPSPRWRWLVGLSLMAAAAFSLGLAINPGPLTRFERIENPYGIKAASQLTLTLTGIFSVIMVLLVLIVAYSLIQRLRHADGIERQQLKWFVYAIGIIALLSPLGPSTSKPVQALFILMTLSIPISVGIAILRYRLYDIDLLINRTLVYVPLTALVAGIFAASVTLSQRFFFALTGQQSDATTAFATLITVAAFEPIKTRLQALVDKRFKEPPDPLKELKAYRAQTQAVLQVIDPEAIARETLEVTVRAFNATSGAIFLGSGQDKPIYTVRAWSSANNFAVTVKSPKGELLARIALGARRDGRAYTEQDRVNVEQHLDLVARALALAGREQNLTARVDTKRVSS